MPGKTDKTVVQIRRVKDVWGYISRHQLPVNPVYAKLRRLGAPESALRVSAMIDGNALELSGSPGCGAAGPTCSTSSRRCCQGCGNSCEIAMKKAAADGPVAAVLMTVI